MFYSYTNSGIIHQQLGSKIEHSGIISFIDLRTLIDWQDIETFKVVEKIQCLLTNHCKFDLGIKCPFCQSGATLVQTLAQCWLQC